MAYVFRSRIPKPVNYGRLKQAYSSRNRPYHTRLVSIRTSFRPSLSAQVGFPRFTFNNLPSRFYSTELPKQYTLPLESVTELLVSNKHEAAIKQCDKIVQQYKDKMNELREEFVQLLSFKADALVKLGRPEQALNTYKEAQQLDSENEMVILQVADMLLELKRYKELLVLCDKIIAINPKEPDSYVLKAKAIVNLIELQENVTETLSDAIQLCDRAIELDKQCADGFITKSKALRLSGKYKEALDAAMLAISIDDDAPAAWLEKSLCEEKLGHSSSAKESLQKAKSLDEDITT